MKEASQLFLLVLTATSVALVIYPFGVYPVTLNWLPRRPVKTDDSSASGSQFSLLFCAYNEINALPEKLNNIAELKERHPNLQVLAYDDGSSDGTLAKLKATPLLDVVIEGEGRMGKAHGMKQLAGLARGEILVFTDANVLVDPSSLGHLSSLFVDDEVGGVCGTLHYINEQESATARAGGAFWRLEERIKSKESATGNVMGADGSIFAVRKNLYPDFPDSVLDDFTVSMSVVFAGYRLIKSDRLMAYERLVTESRDEFSRKIRIATRAYHTHLHLHGQLGEMAIVDRYKYFCHKIVRWYGGLFLIIGALAGWGLVLTYSFPAAAAALLVAPVAYVLSARSRRIAFAREVTGAYVATLIGVYRARRGRTQTTWTPAQSR